MKPWIAVDTETTGLSPHNEGHRMFAYCTGTPDGIAGAWRIDYDEYNKHNPTNKRNRIRLSNLFKQAERGEVEIVFHNAKFDLAFIEKFLGRKVAEKITFHDTMILSKLVHNDADHSLDSLAYTLGGYPKDADEAIKPYTRGNRSYRDVPHYLMHQYMLADAERTSLLMNYFWPIVKRNKAWLKIYRTEMDLITATLRMEQYGMRLDTEAADKMSLDLEQKAFDAHEAVDSVYGPGLNLNAAEDVRKVIFEERGYIPEIFTSKSLEPSTAKEVLLKIREEHDDPYVNNILKFRSYSKAATTIKSYINLADDYGIIHPSIHTSSAVTARESMSLPNLQNVQKSTGLLVPYPVSIRKLFRPRLGNFLLFVDYKGEELRLLIHYSQEAELIEICRQGGDVHEPATIIFFGKNYTKEQRNSAKAVNFAMPYGANDEKAAKMLGMTDEEAAKPLKEWHSRFPSLSRLGREIQTEVHKNGCVITEFGRKVRVPRYKAYVGTNYKIQSTGADIIKIAQVRVHDYFQRVWNGEIKLLVPIHDELIFEIPRKFMKDLKKIISDLTDLMTDFPMFSVPLELDFNMSTTNWEEKKAVNFG